jgi:hypothetical protein
LNEHVKTGRPQGEQDSPRQRISNRMQERGRISSAAAKTREDQPITETPILVLVEWEDSYGCSSNWQDLDHPKPTPMRCRSVGWLYHGGPDCKLLVPHVADGDGNQILCQGCGDMTIPTSAVRSITQLQIPARRA